jgi:hypothetical protein
MIVNISFDSENTTTTPLVTKAMKTNHTPGPWIVSRSNRGMIPPQFQPPEVLARNGNLSVADALGGGSEAEANARLIAAAPDMLTLLCDVSSWLEFHLKHGAIHANTANRDGDLVSQLRGVIAKATA